jgi:cell division protein FtsW
MWKIPSTLAGIVLILLALGIVMLASASTVKGESAHYDAQYFLKRQLAWLGVGILAALFGAAVDYHRWQEHWVPVFALSVALLLFVLLPGIRVQIGGSYRWLRAGPLFSFQPSEFAKLATVIMLSAWMARVGRKAVIFKEGLAKPGVALLVVLALILKEPDYGTTVLIATVGMALLFTGGTRWEYLGVAALIGVCGMTVAVLHDPVRLGRILGFLMPEKYPAIYHQVQQSKYAFVLGGVGGVGLGESMQKHLYLPEAHTDFILAIVGEELGVAATCLVVALFGGFLACGTFISLSAPDVFGRLLGFGLTLMISVQAAINVGVVTGCLPTKGLPLPFISYGGSSLAMTMLMVGVLINIARQAVVEEDGQVVAVKDRAQWF